VAKDHYRNGFLQFFSCRQDWEERITIEHKYREKLQLESCQTDYQQSGI